jgi:hypothetical protein
MRRPSTPTVVSSSSSTRRCPPLWQNRSLVMVYQLPPLEIDQNRQQNRN